MADILQAFPIHAPPARVFEAVSQPEHVTGGVRIVEVPAIRRA